MLPKQGIPSLWHYRYLLFTFAVRDIKSNYAETRLGLLWSLLQPLIGLAIFTFFFDKLLNINTGDIPYPLFALSGMCVWYYFVYIVNNAGSSIIQMQQIIKKMNFPRILCPVSKALSGMLDFIITLILLLVAMSIYGIYPSATLLLLPFLVLLLIGTGLSLGIWLSALTVRHRDLLHAVPYLVSFAIWVTPVFYPVTLLPEAYCRLMYFNPMAAVVEGLRWCVFGGTSPPWDYAFSFIPVAVLFTTGIMYFNRIEGRMAEYL